MTARKASPLDSGHGSLFTFGNTGGYCPGKEAGYGPRTVAATSAVAPAWARELLREVRSFGLLEERVSSGSVGRDSLEASLWRCPLRRYGVTPTFEGNFEVAGEGPLKVVSDKTALPTTAGVVRPADFLCKERADVLRDLPDRPP